MFPLTGAQGPDREGQIRMRISRETRPIGSATQPTLGIPVTASASRGRGGVTLMARRASTVHLSNNVTLALCIMDSRTMTEMVERQRVLYTPKPISIGEIMMEHISQSH